MNLIVYNSIDDAVTLFNAHAKLDSFLGLLLHKTKIKLAYTAKAVIAARVLYVANKPLAFLRKNKPKDLTGPLANYDREDIQELF